MDKRLLYKKIGKLVYKMTYKPRLYRYDPLKKFPKLAQKVSEKIIPKSDELVCLPNDKVVIDQEIDSEEMVLPTQIIEHFIDESSYRVIMNDCICRSSNGCKDFSQGFGCIFMGEAARGIHPNLCREASKEEAKEHIRKAQEKGMINLAGKASFDTLWLDLDDHKRLFTICSCCPCCCISIATPYLSPYLTKWFVKLPGAEVTVSDDCVGCGNCLDVCVFGGIEMRNNKATILDTCMACGRCVSACKSGAIELNINDDSYVSNVIERLSNRVNIGK